MVVIRSAVGYVVSRALVLAAVLVALNVQMFPACKAGDVTGNAYDRVQSALKTIGQVLGSGGR